MPRQTGPRDTTSGVSRAGTELARVLLRMTIGGTMIAHGIKHARTLPGTASWFESIGFRAPRLQAQVSAATEVGAGAALILGLGTTAAGSAVVGTMAVAAETVHRPNGFFITKEGWEYVAVISAATVALSALGPGRWSADRLLGIDDRAAGVPGAVLVAAVGLGGAAAHLRAFWTRRDER